MKAYARLAALAVLAIATVVGVYQFFQGDCRTVLEYWRAKLIVLPLVLLLACSDVLLEAIGWTWVYERFRIRARDAGGVMAYLSGRAGLLLPAQLGRLIRPDAMVRLQRGSPADCLKAEAVAFVLDSTAVLALLVGLGTLMIYPLAALPAAVGVILVAVFLGDRIANVVSDTRLELPAGFWWRWQTFAIIIIEMAGWAAHGLALYVMIRDLPGNATATETMFYAAGSAVLGVGTGLPGGLGATEGFLGLSLSVQQIPAEHLAMAVAAFRLLTFWIWLPVGWTALGLARRSAARRLDETPADASPAESIIDDDQLLATAGAD